MNSNWSYTGWPISWRTWVGLTLIWEVPPSCPAAQPVLLISHQPRQNQAEGGKAKIKVNPTEVHQEMCHPVSNIKWDRKTSRLDSSEPTHVSDLNVNTVRTRAAGLWVASRCLSFSIDSFGIHARCKRWLNNVTAKKLHFSSSDQCKLSTTYYTCVVSRLTSPVYQTRCKMKKVFKKEHFLGSFPFLQSF